MNTNEFSRAAGNMIGAFGTTAHSAIDAYRAGGEQLGTVAALRWASALRTSGPQLSAETRKNAQHARKVIGGYYSRGVTLSADGAERAVDALVDVAGKAVERGCALAASRGRKAA